MIHLAVLLGAAALAYGLAKWFRLPTIPLLVVTGLTLEWLADFPPELLQEALVLGLTFLLFAAGLELNPHRVRAQRRAALRVGVIQFVALGALGVLAALSLGLAPLTAVYLGLALTASSTLVVVRLLSQRKQLFEPFGRLVVGVLLVQDLLVILLIPLLLRAPMGPRTVLAGVAGILGMMAAAYLVLRWVTPLLARLQWEDEPLLLAALAVLVVFVGMADLLALPLAAGSFLAGVALSPFPVRGLVRGQLVPVVDFFTAMFFLALGALITLPPLPLLLQALVLSLLVIVATPPLVTYLAERHGFTARPGVEAGLLLAQTSEISLVVGLHALAAGQIDGSVFTTLALVTVLTMALTPLVAGHRAVEFLLRHHPERNAARHRMEAHEGHVLLVGCGSGGMPLLETLVAAGEPVVVIDDDPEVIQTLREGDVPCVRGDAADPVVLHATSASAARLVSSTVRRPRDNGLLLEAAGDAPVLVRVFDDEDAEWVRDRGGIPVAYAEAGAEAFLAWYARTFAGNADPAPAEALRGEKS